MLPLILIIQWRLCGTTGDIKYCAVGNSASLDLTGWLIDQARGSKGDDVKSKWLKAKDSNRTLRWNVKTV